MTICLCSHPDVDHDNHGLGRCWCGCPSMRPDEHAPLGFGPVAS